MAFKHYILAIGGALLLAACGAPGDKYFETPPAQAAAAIKAAQFPTILAGRNATARVFEEGGKIITALSDEDGVETMRYVTTITPEGTGSRVKTVLQPPPGGTMPKYTDEYMAVLAGTEFVTSAIEGRPFDLGVGGLMAGSEETLRAGQMAQEMSRIEQAPADVRASNEWKPDDDDEENDWGQPASTTEDGWGQ